MLAVSVGAGLAAAGVSHKNGSSTATAVGAGVAVTTIAAILPRTVRFLSDGQQLRVERLTEKVVYNGPCTVVLNPLTTCKVDLVKGESLGATEFLKVKDTLTGQTYVEKGPKLKFLGANETVAERGSGTTLSKTEYLVVENELTGESATVRGPQVWFPTASSVAGRKMTAIALQEDEYIRVRDDATGQRWVQKGKDLVFLEPTQRVEGSVRKAWTLKAYEYVRLLDSVTGKVTVHRGESTVFPGSNEELLDGDKLTATELKANEYVKVVDKTNGKIRVVAGPELLFLGANETLIDNGKKQAIDVDEEHAVLVRDISTAQLRLVTEKQLFIPGPDETIEEVRTLIRLADHEGMITKDKDGILHFHYGNPQRNKDMPRAFFLPPYAEILELNWSSGLRRAKRDLVITRFDCRPQYLWNEIDCRTSDNVELVLETTIFWEASDLATMVRKTGNLPGDIYNQIRSQFIKHVAKVTLKGFMESLHNISRTVFEEDTGFYTSRGITIHSLEVTKYMCSEKRTSDVLQQIIEETTNRLNRLSQAEGENEVRIFKMQGQIEQEKLNSELLTIQHEHSKLEAAVGGSAEAERASAFLKGLEKDVPKLEDRVSMWQTLRKQDALSVVSKGGASLYYTPNDVNLSIRDGA
eukprot:TRINITY_DN1380_c0_g1_i3.p1 TRINITY_DN1380_c0_g1~~TRINITY_DN1380_c0_g1_i3.p1  ORF type:complete len:639 (-),score=125.92 TRINITY_DN1380_c0_g1_i3:265-2181(-)